MKPPTTTTIQSFINAKAAEKARAEWKELMEATSAFFKRSPSYADRGSTHPNHIWSEYTGLASSGYERHFHHKEHRAKFGEFCDSLKSFGVAWQKERTEFLIKAMTAELLKKCDLLSELGQGGE